MRRATSAVTWYDRGCALEVIDPVAAVAAYHRAIAGMPGAAVAGAAYNNLGRMHHERGELVDAEGCYRLALCCSDDLALYWFNLGVVLEDTGRRAEAMAAYEHALSLDAALADA